jgi:histidyl-tRNA synthetase
MNTTTSSAPPSGMRDFLPEEVALRDWATAKLIQTYQRFGFTRIETPALESIGNLRRSDGGENLQLIFEVLKRGEKLSQFSNEPLSAVKDQLADLGLRFDLTVPLVRFYANNQSNLPNPFKTIQIGNVWRAESAQAGRFRQFTQCDIDTFGIKTETAEMELIEATAEALSALGFKDFIIRLNDRRVLGALANFCEFEQDRHDNVFIQIDKLDKIGIDGVEKELIKHGHAPDTVRKLLQYLTKFAGSQSSDVRATGVAQFADEEVLQQLENVIKAVSTVADGNYKIVFDPTLVRGMGYYTGQIFEITVPGYSGSIAGGGRYDKMVGKMSGRDVPAVGFSIGFERIIAILSERKSGLPDQEEKLAIIYDADRDDMEQVLKLAKEKRDAGTIVSLLPRKKEMKKQLDALAAQGFASFAVYKTDASNLEIKQLG